MTEWTDGYRAALADVARVSRSRGLSSPELGHLLNDLLGDALVIERQQAQRLQRRRLRAVKEEPELDLT